MDWRSDSDVVPDTEPIESSPSGEHESIWLDTSATTSYEPLERTTQVDTAVISAGIAGVTTAAKLREAGQSVALFEQDRVLSGVTGHTTAKLTSQHGLLYADLIADIGRRRACLYHPGDPYFSVRPYPAGEGNTVLFGGENHRTGHGGTTTEHYRALERTVRRRFDVLDVDYR